MIHKVAEDTGSTNLTAGNSVGIKEMNIRRGVMAGDGYSHMAKAEIGTASVS